MGVFNLIPMIFERLTADEPPRVFGDDYPTPDGTCVRDYIHVDGPGGGPRGDGPRAGRRHRAANSPSTSAGAKGVSVREMIDRVNAVTGRTLPPVVAPRRPGDPASVVASAARIATELGWKAKHDVQDMITSAWEGWVRLHPEAGTTAP